MTKEEYTKRMGELDLIDFFAEMSDDFRCWESEKRAVREERERLMKEAKEAGII